MTTTTTPTTHTCVRIYNNGDRVTVTRKADLDEWLEFNSTFRFGCALFVDGRCVHRGYMENQADRVLELERELTTAWVNAARDPAERQTRKATSYARLNMGGKAALLSIVTTEPTT